MIKKVFWISQFLLLIFGSSCTEKYKQKIETLKAELIQKNIESQKRERFIVDSLDLQMKYTLTQIDSEMARVLRNEGVLVEGELDPEYRMSHTERVKYKVNRLQTLLKTNKAKVDEMISRLSKVEGQNKSLIASLEDTRRLLAERENEVDMLASNLDAQREKTAFLEERVTQLFVENDSLLYGVQELDRKVNKAYFIVGDYKELKSKGVVDREGGILTIGSTHVLNDDFNASAFKEVDIRQNVRVEIKANKAELITEHPSDSYSFKSDGEKIAALEINDPSKFWRASKYMVIETK